MTPFSFEWQWNADYLVFMGLLYIALLIIGCGLVYALVKTWLILGQESEVPPKIPQRENYWKY
jgi:hypothetical protein